MPHCLILGMTMSGKTTLAKHLVRGFKKAGIKTIVLDPLNDPEWNADFQTPDRVEFLRVCKASTQCAIFVDESGQEIGRYAGEMQWLATQSRHWGHRAHFLSQRASQLDKTVRDQCVNAFIFRVSKKDADVLAEEFSEDKLKEAATLGKFEYLKVGRFQKPIRAKVAPLPKPRKTMEDEE